VETQEEPLIRRLTPDDAAALGGFYDGLSDRAKRLFRPLGIKSTPEQCRDVAEGNLPAADTHFDLIAMLGDRLVGWAFLWNQADKPGEAALGLAVADDVQGRGIGRRLMAALMAAARARRLRRINLTVVQDNLAAQRLYEECGFIRTGSLTGSDGLDYFSMTQEVSPQPPPLSP